MFLRVKAVRNGSTYRSTATFAALVYSGYVTLVDKIFREFGKKLCSNPELSKLGEFLASPMFKTSEYCAH